MNHLGTLLRAAWLGLATFALVTAAVVACQSQPTPTPPPAQPPVPLGFAVPTVQGTPGRTLNLKGSFVYVADDGNLTLQDASTGATRQLVKTGSAGYAQFPAFSPDGQRVAYTYSSFTKEGQILSQIRVIQIDGSNEKTILAPADTKTIYDLPAWAADGQSLFVTTTSSVPPAGQQVELDRVSAAGGPLTRVLENGSNAAASPDGKKIVYQLLDYNLYTSALWIADIDGSNGHVLVEPNTFAALFGARFSPDSTSIVFAGSGAPKKRLPGAQGFLRTPASPARAQETASACLFALLSDCWLRRAEAHGLPWDLWQVNLDGTRFERLTELGADSPVPVWSGDGSSICFFEATGIYWLDVANKTVSLVSKPGGYGGFDWR